MRLRFSIVLSCLVAVASLFSCAKGSVIVDGPGGAGGTGTSGPGPGNGSSAANAASSSGNVSSSASGGASCGDTNCDPGETCMTCPADCGQCGPVCPNGQCEAGETCMSCPSDCGQCPNNCAHDLCVTGVKLDPNCDQCADDVCFFDSYCCTTAWDSACVSEVNSYCIGKSCP
jgi:hypothetical protein